MRSSNPVLKDKVFQGPFAVGERMTMNGTIAKTGEQFQNDEVAPASNRIMLRVYLAGGVGLLAVIGSIVLSVPAICAPAGVPPAGGGPEVGPISFARDAT